MKRHQKASRERVRLIWRVLRGTDEAMSSANVAQLSGSGLATTQRYLRAMDRLDLVERTGKANTSRYRAIAVRCSIDVVLDEARGSKRAVPDQIDEEKAIVMAAAVWVDGTSVRAAGRRANVHSAAAHLFFHRERRPDLFDVVLDMFKRGRLDALADDYVDDDESRYLTYARHGRSNF